MGISIGSGGGSCSCLPPSRNPDPSNFEILALEQIEGYLAVRLRYLDCTNYEGEKILVFEGVSARGFLACDTVDPHFDESSEHLLIARFCPTEDGWQNARMFCTQLGELDHV